MTPSDLVFSNEQIYQMVHENDRLVVASLRRLFCRVDESDVHFSIQDLTRIVSSGSRTVLRCLYEDRKDLTQKIPNTSSRDGANVGLIAVLVSAISFLLVFSSPSISTII